MDEKMKDQSDHPVLGHIERLVAEEHKLYNQGALAEEGVVVRGHTAGFAIKGDRV